MGGVQQLVEAIDGEAGIGEEELPVEAEDEQAWEGLVLWVTGDVRIGQLPRYASQHGAMRPA